MSGQSAGANIMLLKRLLVFCAANSSSLSGSSTFGNIKTNYLGIFDRKSLDSS